MTEEMPKLTRIERRDVDVVVTYNGGSEFTVTYDDLRHACLLYTSDAADE